jgi:hypothetical protein
MPTSRTCLVLLLGALLTVGCSQASATDHASASESAIGESGESASIAEGSIEADGVLLLVNDRGTTSAAILSGRAGVDATVAQAIVAYRTDESGKPRWYKTLAELDAIPGTTAAVFHQLLADARANNYVDEGDLVPPTLAQIEVPDILGVPATSDTVKVNAGFDGMSADDVLRLVRGRVPNNIHRDNEQFLLQTIRTTFKAFTLGIGNLFVESAPFASWLRGLQADEITMLGTVSAIHPTVLKTKKDGVESYWVRNAQGYEPIDWPTYHYPILMRAHVRLETDPAGQGVRVFYPACPLKVLESPTSITVEENPDP